VTSHLHLHYYSFLLDLIQVQAQAQAQAQVQVLVLAQAQAQAQDQDQDPGPSLVQSHAALTFLLAAGPHYPLLVWVNGVQEKASVASCARLPAALHGVAAAEVSSFHRGL